MQASFLPLVCVVIACLLTPSVESQGRIAPLVPEEYYCNIVQHKNGFNVNHTYSLEYYSSHAQQMVRADGIFGVAPTNEDPSNVTAFMQLSLLDFRGGAPGVNTYLAIGNLDEPINCTVGPVEGFFAPPPKTFLRDINAIYAGSEVIEFYGPAQKWAFFLTVEGAATAITFYFSDDEAATFLRWDLVSTGLLTGVNTWMYNLKEVESLPSRLFAGSQQCPKGTRPNYIKAHNPAWMPLMTGL